MPSSADSKRRVLVIDDEACIVDLIVEFIRLKNPDLEIHGMTTAQEALEAVQKEPYDLVITDLNMPEMSGFDLLERILEIHPATRVILISGHVEHQHTQAAFKLGAAALLQKPLNIRELLSTVKTLLSEAW